jgi:hypothetical protein
MRLVEGDAWKRGGLSLLWGPEALSEIAQTADVASVRDLFLLSRAWPGDLPSNAGQTLVVAGVEGCLDCLTPEDAESWIESDLRPVLLRFQEEYEGQCALVLWLPTGHRRVGMNRANETYRWKCNAPYSGREIEIGRILWGGAESDAGRIMDSRNPNRDPDGPAWIGLHHPRLS